MNNTFYTFGIFKDSQWQFPLTKWETLKGVKVAAKKYKNSVIFEIKPLSEKTAN